MGQIAGHLDYYRGPDRRSRRPEVEHAVTPTASAPQFLAATMVIVIPVIFSFARGADPFVAADLLSVMTASLAIGAGLAAFVTWKVRGSAFTGRFGMALATFGILRLTMDFFPPWRDSQQAVGQELCDLIVAVVVATMAVRAMRGPEVDSRFSPLRSLLWPVLVGLGALGAQSALDHTGLLSFGAGNGLRNGLLAATAAVWTSVALVASSSRRHRPKIALWCPVVLIGLAVEPVIQIVVPTGSGWWNLTGSSTSALSTVLAVTAAFAELQRTIKGQDRHARRLRADLTELEEQMIDEKANLDELVHDLRNAVSAMRSTDAALRLYGSRLDEGDRIRLADALSAELARLQVLIEPGRRPSCVDFALADVLAPVVEAERTFGVDIEVHLGDVEVRGDPLRVAQVVQNLLSNARKYAPGSPVTLSAAAMAGRVELRVQDEGPGIAEAEQMAIFSRGRRGQSSIGTDGEGLGLFVSARLMEDIGGSIALVTSSGRGACFRLEMPAAPISLNRLEQIGRVRSIGVVGSV